MMSLGPDSGGVWRGSWCGASRAQQRAEQWCDVSAALQSTALHGQLGRKFILSATPSTGCGVGSVCWESYTEGNSLCLLHAEGTV